MMDAFAKLGLERRAALDAEALKAAWIERGRAAHPDHAGGEHQESAEINAAYELLSEPNTRLKHLLEIDYPQESKAWATVPMDEELMTLFMKLGPLLQKVEALAKKCDTAASALAKALLANEQMALQEEVEEQLRQLEGMSEKLEGSLEEIDALRANGDRDRAFERMRRAQAAFAYLSKWQRQAREALMKLV